MEEVKSYYVLLDVTPRYNKQRHFVTLSAGVSTDPKLAMTFDTVRQAESIMDALSLVGEEQYKVARMMFNSKAIIEEL